METLFQEYLNLSAFSGERPEGFRRLQQFFSNRFGPVGMALLMVRDLEAGAAKLVALIRPDRHVEVELNDPFLDSATLYHDALTRRLMAAGACHLNLNAALLETRFGRHLAGAATIAAAPLALDGSVHHWLVLFSPNGDAFAELDEDRLMLEINLGSNLMRGAMALRALRETSERQQHEIDSLANVQRLLLPPEKPQIDGVQIAVHYQAAEIAAGDYYDLMALSHYFPEHDGGADVWGVMVADVSGHGPAAAMEAAMFDAILRTFQAEDANDGPGDVMTYANRFFFTRRVRPHFLTAFGANYNPATRELRYACAGHPSPLLLSGDEVTEFSDNPDIPLGVLRDSSWRTHTYPMQAGDTLVIFTDGLIEANNAAGEQFGMQRMAAAVREGRGDAESVRDRVLSRLFHHQGGAIGHDDQTLIVLHQTS